MRFQRGWAVIALLFALNGEAWSQISAGGCCQLDDGCMYRRRATAYRRVGSQPRAAAMRPLGCAEARRFAAASVRNARTPRPGFAPQGRGTPVRGATCEPQGCEVPDPSRGDILTCVSECLIPNLPISDGPPPLPLNAHCEESDQCGTACCCLMTVPLVGDVGVCIPDWGCENVLGECQAPPPPPPPPPGAAPRTVTAKPAVAATARSWSTSTPAVHPRTAHPSASAVRESPKKGKS